MEITNEILSQFRLNYPEFSNVTIWPDIVVNKALCEGDAETGSSRWGGYENDCHNFKQRGMFLFAAHWLATTYINQDATDPTVVDPETRLNVQSKTVGDESVAYRVPSILGLGDDWLSTSNYGVQFFRLRKRAGMGAVAV